MVKTMRLLFLAALLLPFAASAQLVTSVPIRPLLLYSNGIIAGNGADTTEDTIMSVSMPANTLVNVGDTLHIVVRGVAAANTDTKTTRVRFGGAQVIAITQNSATTTLIYLFQVWITVTGVNTQTSISYSQNGTATSTSNTVPLTATTTAPIVIATTGINATNPTANSVQVNMMFVEFYPAGS